MISVSVAWAAPQAQFELALQLPDHASIADALAAARDKLQSGSAALAGQVDWDGAKVGVFGQVRDRQWRLRAGDRVEIYRPLLVDPKDARRARAKRLRGAR